MLTTDEDDAPILCYSHAFDVTWSEERGVYAVCKACGATFSERLLYNLSIIPHVHHGEMAQGRAQQAVPEAFYREATTYPESERI